MNTLQFQTRHGRRLAWFNLALFTVGLGVFFPALWAGVGGIDGAALIALAVFFLTPALAGVIFVTRERGGLISGRDGLRAVIAGVPNFAPAGFTARNALGFREETRAVWLTMLSHNGRTRWVGSMLHVASRSHFSSFFRVPNELMVRNPAAPTRHGRQWQATGFFWTDGNDQTVVEYLVRAIDGRFAMPASSPIPGVPLIAGEVGYSAYAMSDSRRLRIPGFPRTVIPPSFVVYALCLVALLLSPSAGSVDPANGVPFPVTSVVFVVVMLASLFFTYGPKREVRIEPGAVRESKLLELGRLWPAAVVPRFAVDRSRHGGVILALGEEEGGHVPLIALQSHQAMDSSNVLLVRFPTADDPNLRCWRSTGLNWGDGGESICTYLEMVAEAADDHGGVFRTEH